MIAGLPREPTMTILILIMIKYKEKYGQMKKNIRNTKIRDELSENSRGIRENRKNA